MKLAEYLKQNLITHEAFAKKVGVSRALITRIANRKKNPSVRLVVKITQLTSGVVTASDLYNPEINPVYLKEKPSSE